ncbi:MAG: AraC family transcriptional regulator ligand-binding domain-containing protein [Pseudomonadota bacterium]
MTSSSPQRDNGSASEFALAPTASRGRASTDALSIDHHRAVLRIARELAPDFGFQIPDALWDEFSQDLSSQDRVSQDFSDENAAFNLHQQLTFHRRLLELVNDPLLGLKMAKMFPPQAYGMFGLANLCAPDQRRALRFVGEYGHLAYTLQTPYFRETDGFGILEFNAPSVKLEPALQRFFSDRDLAATVYAFRVALQGRAPLAQVTIAHGDQGRARDYEAFFECPVAFRSPRNQIIIADQDLDRPNPFRNAAAFEACRRECDRQLADLIGQRDVVSRVRQALMQRPGYLQDIGSIAQSMNTSPRTLRRRLDAAGESFIALQQETRFAQAKEYLRASTLPIAKIADILGYSEPGNFTTAFKRWSDGVSPRRFRQESAGRAAS